MGQLVTSPTADPGIVNLIPSHSHTFVEIDHEIISTVILLLPLIQEGLIVVSYKQSYAHKILVNHLVKLAQEKMWLGKLTIAVDRDVKNQTKPKSAL